MNESYIFLKQYGESLSDVVGADLKGRDYYLKPGVDRRYLSAVQLDEEILIPDELLSLYEFTYGAKLGEYILLTIPEIVNLMSELRDTYSEQWLEGILPVFYVQGVGDTIAMNTRQVDNRGLIQILDGFHELPPPQWQGIGYGLRFWLLNMVRNHFRPYWLGDDESKSVADPEN